jgi:hypothetical protein
MHSPQCRLTPAPTLETNSTGRSGVAVTAIAYCQHSLRHRWTEEGDGQKPKFGNFQILRGGTRSKALRADRPHCCQHGLPRPIGLLTGSGLKPARSYPGGKGRAVAARKKGRTFVATYRPAF